MDDRQIFFNGDLLNWRAMFADLLCGWKTSGNPQKQLPAWMHNFGSHKTAIWSFLYFINPSIGSHGDETQRAEHVREAMLPDIMKKQPKSLGAQVVTRREP